MKRPLALASAAFAAGVLLALLHDFPLIPLALLFTGASGFLFVLLRSGAARQAILLALVFFLCGVFYTEARDRGDPPLLPLLRTLNAVNIIAEGVVREAPLLMEHEDYARLIVDVDTVELRGGRHETRGGAVIRWLQPDTPLLPGDRIRLRGEVSLRLSEVNHGIRSYESFLRGRDVVASITLRGDNLDLLGHTRGWRRLLGAAREYQAAVLSASMPREVVPFILTVWLGERSRTTEAQMDAYIKSGTAHILSVSGVHVVIIFSSAMLLFQVLGVPRRARLLLAMGAVFAFAFLAGARPATLRAALMLGLALLAQFFDREQDNATGLGFSAFILLLLDPRNMIDAGFILSFSSVASMILFIPMIRGGLLRVPRLPRWLLDALAVSLAVIIVPLPIAADYFHIIPVLSPIGNLVVVPVLTLVLWLCFAATLFGMLLPALAPLPGHAIAPLVKLIEALTAGVAHAPGSHLIVTSPGTATIALYLAGVLLLLWASQRHLPRAFSQHPKLRRSPAALMIVRWTPGILCILLAVLFWRPLAGGPRVDFLDVGHGDAAFIRTPGGFTMLVDGGDLSQYADTGRRVIEPWLLANGITGLDAIMVSHPDRDHIGGLLHIARNWPVGEMIMGPQTASPNESEMIRICHARNIPIRRIHAPLRFEAGGATIEVFHPPAQASARGKVNNQSIVCRVAWEDFSVLFTGDVEEAAERAFTDRHLGAAIFKSPHHGSITSSTPALVAAAAPRDVIISTAGPRAKAPLSQAVLERYYAAGARVWRTDLDGGLRVVPLAGGRYEVYPARTW